MAWSFDAYSAGQDASVSSITVSHVLGSGNNRMVTVGVTLSDATAQGTVTGVTLNGVAMTDAGFVSNVGRAIGMFLWTMFESDLPAGGTYDVVASFSGTPDECCLVTQSYADILVDSRYAAIGSTVTAKTISNSITTVTDNDLVVDFATSTVNNKTLGADSGQTVRGTGSGALSFAGGDENIATAGLITNGWSYSGASGNMVQLLQAFETYSLKIEPPQTNLTLSQTAPTVEVSTGAVSHTRTPPQGDVALTQDAPIVVHTQNHFATVPAVDLGLTTVAPDVFEMTVITTPFVDMVLSAFVPTVVKTNNHVRAPPAASLNFSYITTAIGFDGGSDYLARFSDFTNVQDSRTILYSFWFEVDGGSATTRVIKDSNSGKAVYTRITTSDKLVITLYDDVGLLLNVSSVSSVGVGTGRHHALFSYDIDTDDYQFYIDDVFETSGAVSPAGTDIRISDTQHKIGISNGIDSSFRGCLFDYYIALDNTLDITSAAVRRKFIDENGDPVFLGDDGSKPDGNQPLVFLKGDTSTFKDNLGYGGSLTVTGTLLDCVVENSTIPFVSKFIDTPATNLTLSSSIPELVLTANVIITPPAADLSLVSVAPTATESEQPPQADLVISVSVPTVVQTTTEDITVPVVDLLLTPTVPTVLAAAAIDITVPAADLQITTTLPTAVKTDNVLLTVGAAQLVVDPHQITSNEFDGTSDYMIRTGDHTGNADGKKGIISLWVRRDVAGAVHYLFTSSDASAYNISFNGVNQYQIRGNNAAGTEILRILTTAPTDGLMHHYLSSWDLENDYAETYLDDVLTQFTPLKTNDDIDYTHGEHSFGSTILGGQKLNGCVGVGAYFNMAETLDLSKVENRRKFIDASGNPVGLGATGQLPTGTAPIIFLDQDYLDAGSNAGGGDDYTVTGSVTDCDLIGGGSIPISALTIGDGAGDLAISTTAPTIVFVDNVAISTPFVDLTLTTILPTVVLTSGISITIPSVELLLTQAAPTVTESEQPPQADLALTGAAPTLVQTTTEDITPASVQLSFLGYQTDGAKFDGTNDWLARGAALTSVVNGSKGIVSFWIDFNSTANTSKIIDMEKGLSINHSSTNKKFTIEVLDAAFAVILQAVGNVSVDVSDGLSHVICSFDTSTGDIEIYIGDVQVTSSVSVLSSNDVFWQGDNTFIGRRYSSASQKVNACLYDLYLNTDDTIDLTVTANRRKFITAAGDPVDLGSTGAAPTGSQPAVFLKGDETDIQDNLGYGGAFTVTGALADCPIVGAAGSIPLVAVSIQPAIDDLVLSSDAPTVVATANRDITVPVVDLLLTPTTPTVEAAANFDVAPPQSDLTLTLTTPTVVHVDNHSISVPSADLSVASYQTTSVDFDGTNDWLTRGADLTGNSDGAKGILSFFIDFDVSGSQHYVYANDGGRINIRKRSDNILSIQLANSGGTVILNMETTVSLLDTDGLLHVLASWDQGTTGNSHLYLNDVDRKSLITDSTGTIEYTRSNHALGALIAGGSKHDGCYADFYLNLAETLDLSVASNRRKFSTTDNKPVDTGSDGSLPTGTQPIVFLKGGASVFGDNLGSGGTFTVNGSLDDCEVITTGAAGRPTVVVSITVPVVDLALSSDVPTVFASAHIDISVPFADLIITAEAPSILTAVNHSMEVPQGDLLLTSVAVQRSVSNIITIPVADLDLSNAIGDLVPSVLFDGTNDYLSRGADLTGNVDHKNGMFSFWVDNIKGDGTLRKLYDTDGTFKNSIYLDTDNKIWVVMLTSGGLNAVVMKSTTTLVEGSGRHHICGSWAPNISARWLFIDDVDRTDFVAGTNVAVDYTKGDHWIGSAAAGTSAFFNGCVYDFWFAPANYRNFSTVSERRKFIDASLDPVDLGDNGETPLGSAPLIFLRGDKNTFADNLGDGGTFTVGGALEDCFVEPPVVRVSIQPAIDNLVLSSVAPTVAATDNVDITVPFYSMMLSTDTPDVQSGASVSKNPPAGNLTLTTEAPTVAQTENHFVTVPAVDLSLVSVAPALSTNFSFEIPSANLSLSSVAPSVVASISPPVRDLVLNSVAPTVFTSDVVTVTTPVVDLVLDSVAPTVVRTANIAISVPAGDLVIDTTAPALGAGENITTPVVNLTLDSVAPSVALTEHRDISVPNSDLNLTQTTIVVSSGTVITTPQTNLNLSKVSPSVLVSITVDVPQGTLSLSSTAPSLGGTVNVTTPVGTLTLDSVAPSVVVTEHRSIQVPNGDLLVSSVAPDVVSSAGVVIEVPTADLLLTGSVPTLRESVQITAVDLSLSTEAPLLSEAIQRLPLSGGISFSSTAPNIVEKINILVPSADLTLTPTMPQLGGQTNITVPTGDIIFSGQVPSVRSSISIPAAELSVSTTPPEHRISITVPAADLLTSSFTPIVLVSVSVTTPTATLGLATTAPSVAVAFNVTVPVANLTISVVPPDVTTSEAPPAADLILQTTAPSVRTSIEIPAANLTLTTTQSVIDAGTHPAQDDLVLSGTTPTIEINTPITIPAANLNISTVAVGISQSISIPAAQLTLSTTLPKLAEVVSKIIPQVNLTLSGSAPTAVRTTDLIRVPTVQLALSTEIPVVDQTLKLFTRPPAAQLTLTVPAPRRSILPYRTGLTKVESCEPNRVKISNETHATGKPEVTNRNCTDFDTEA